MPAFYILVFLAVLILFFLLSGLYRPLGKFFGTIFRDAKRIIEEEDDQIND